MKLTHFSAIMLLLFLVQTFVFAQEFKGDDIIGTWKTGDGNLKIKISKTGDTYLGIIVWMKEPNEANGNPKLDKYNRDEKKRKNPILGNANMLDKFKYVGKGTWDNGEIYDARSGKTYSCIIKMKGLNKIDVRGYIGFSILGQTDTWERVE